MGSGHFESNTSSGKLPNRRPLNIRKKASSTGYTRSEQCLLLCREGGGAVMGWFKRRAKPGSAHAITRDELAHLEQFSQSRRGVEAYTEPQTNVTAMTVVLIAHDGEWTRRRIGSSEQAAKLAERLAIPIYDVAAVGYPSRMREWTRRQKELKDAG